MSQKLDPNQMSFFQHLEELRNRLIKSVLLWVVVFVLCFTYIKPIFEFLAQPIYDLTLHSPFAAFDPKEPFFAMLRASVWVSLFLSSGIFFYQLWAFVAPGLTRDERRFALFFITFMALFFLGGCIFSFYQLFPAILEFLLSWNTDGESNYTRSKYLDILIGFVLGTGVCFEMPLVIFFLAKVRLVTARFLLSKFKYAVLIIFVIAAVITPTPDPYTQTLLAGPMLLLYLLGIGMAATVKPRPAPPATEDEETSLSLVE